MNIYPYRSETLILDSDCEEISRIIEMNTRQKGDGIEEGNRVFRGVFSESGFKITLDIREHVNFIPLISGKLEKTSSGCLLFLSYQMLWGSLVMVAFWSLMAVLFSLFFIYIHNEPLYGWIALAVGFGNYIITLLSFNRMTKRGRRELMEILRMDNNQE